MEHLFTVEAMNTVFSIRLHHSDRTTAERLAGSCFVQLEELEAQLSRYRPDSEISRINNLKTGEDLFLSDATYRCMQHALAANSITAGLFDATLGSQTKEEDGMPEVIGKLILSPDRPCIHCEEAGRQIDLGGIGKGFALDEMAQTLKEMNIESALLSAGASTHLAFGSDTWPFDLQGDNETVQVELNNQAMSASGIGIQGAHVIHPDTGAAPDYHFKRIWLVTALAVYADAFSTACQIMDPNELDGFIRAHTGQIRVYTESLPDLQVHQKTV